MKVILVRRIALLGTLTVAPMLIPVVSGAAGAPASWPYSNGNLANTRDAVGSTITSANVSRLKKLWSFTLTGKAAKSVGGYGTLAANPIVQDGVVYMQDLSSNVYALSLATGQLKWEYVLNLPQKTGPGPNGVAVANGMVYGVSPYVVFALNAANGKKVWGHKNLLKKGQGTFGIQPQVANGRVYLASQYGDAKGGGILLALNATNGKLLWKFNTIKGPEPGPQSFGLGAGGAWETPLVNSNNTVTYGIGNPYQTIGEAYAQPAKLLYTDSAVTLNATTGKLLWYYQAVPNDFKDWDLQASPIAATIKNIPVVIAGGKMGDVYEMNAKTGKLLWKTPVGEHNGHDNDSLKALKHTMTMKLPYTYLPGAYGGILTNMAFAGNVVYAATVNIPLEFSNAGQVNGGAPKGITETGDMVALNALTGKIIWNTKLDGLPDGAATVSNNLVFTTLFENKLVAINRTTGAIVLTRQLPRSSNSPLAIAGNTIIVPVGGPQPKKDHAQSQIIAYSVPSS